MSLNCLPSSYCSAYLNLEVCVFRSSSDCVLDIRKSHSIRKKRIVQVESTSITVIYVILYNETLGEKGVEECSSVCVALLLSFICGDFIYIFISGITYGVRICRCSCAVRSLPIEIQVDWRTMKHSHLLFFISCELEVTYTISFPTFWGVL